MGFPTSSNNLFSASENIQTTVTGGEDSADMIINDTDDNIVQTINQTDMGYDNITTHKTTDMGMDTMRDDNVDADVDYIDVESEQLHTTSHVTDMGATEDNVIINTINATHAGHND